MQHPKSIEAAFAPSFGDYAPYTRGVRVDRRAGLVDTLENLLSGGQREKILTATLAAAGLEPNGRLLDVGCGTGKLAIAAAQIVGSQGKVTGIDATPGMITRARANARDSNSTARFYVEIGEKLPFTDASMTAVTSSYFFHHLPGDVKERALQEMWRVLMPGGRLVITDYGTPQNLLGHICSFPMRFDYHEYVREQLGGELEELIERQNIGAYELVDSFLGYINVIRIQK
ncbi:class I SAM-dependent methyltransferase [Terrihabitans soli]|nr:methyltransferase domain-containing protein [Terrihabitans soli]